MAKGKSKAHSKNPRPGKSNKVTAQAALKPIIVTPSATPRDKIKVLRTYSGSTVCAISRKMLALSGPHDNHEANRANTGTLKSRASRLKASERSQGKSMGKCNL